MAQEFGDANSEADFRTDTSDAVWLPGRRHPSAACLEGYIPHVAIQGMSALINNRRDGMRHYEASAPPSNLTRILRIINKGKDGGDYLTGVSVFVTDDGEEVMARIDDHLRTMVWSHPRIKARSFVTRAFYEIEIRLAILDQINPTEMEMLPHSVPVILSSHERSEGLTKAFHRPRLIRGSAAFVLREQHAALHGNVEPRMALLFAEKLNYRPIRWLISVNFLLCVGVGGIAYGVTNYSVEAALKWAEGLGVLLSIFQGLTWLFN